jgi:hypothetical protein
MPNWCECRLTLCGPTDDVLALCDLVAPVTEPGSSTLPPLPAICARAVVRSRQRVHRSASGRSLDGDSVTSADCRFDFPWSAPLAWLDEACERFPCVVMKLAYYVPDSPCAGVARFEAGVCIESAEYGDEARIDEIAALVYAEH